jgi:uncharacterized protein
MMIDHTTVVRQTAEHVKALMTGERSGHDWWHVYRVWRGAVYISAQEPVDRLVVELVALLHDIADWKFHDGDNMAGPRAARMWLQSIAVDQGTIAHVCEIIKDLSFRGAGVPTPMRTLEGQVVQDADLLDAIGAVGIARAFAYDGYRGRAIYDPEVDPEVHTSAGQYLNETGTTINHFYEKLLLLKDLMNTNTARALAEERHAFMQDFLDRFFHQWNGKV